MASEVYFATAGGRFKMGPVEKLRALYRKAGFADAVKERDLTAVKVHFGERGCTTFVPAHYIRVIVEEVSSSGGRPFLTDTGCLYFSARSNARDHLLVASEHGFSPGTTTAPILIADGLRGSDVTPVEVNLRHFDLVDVASAIHDADSLITISHATGHGLTGFAATIKNLGMGAGGRRMKMSVHEEVRPLVDEEKCDLCRGCLENCPAGAISFADDQISIDYGACYGCGECLAVCSSRAISIKWEGDSNVAQEKLAEVTLAALSNKKGRAGFFVFVINVTPTCDCWNYSAPSLIPDIGYLASTDPVAIDQAAADLVNEALLTGQPPDRRIDPATPDKFLAAHGVPWQRQLEYAEELGLGTREYRLVRLEG